MQSEVIYYSAKPGLSITQSFAVTFYAMTYMTFILAESFHNR